MHSLTANMKTSLILRFIVSIATVALFSFPARAEILKVVVNDTIQPISGEYIARALDEAHRRNAQAVLIEINTPGGLVAGMLVPRDFSFLSLLMSLPWLPERQPEPLTRSQSLVRFRSSRTTK